MEKQEFIVLAANGHHAFYAQEICDEMAASAQARGTGIAKRTAPYIAEKINEGKAVIAMSRSGEWAGFCYIETWGHGQYVANSGLIVAPKFRKSGLAKEIKKKIFEISRTKYPNSKIFGLTTGLAVMKINSDLGYEPVTYAELTDDEEFWKGCRSCVNHEILRSKGRKNCMCTAMLYDPVEKEKSAGKKFWDVTKNSKLYERFIRLKQSILLKGSKKEEQKTESKKSVFSFLNF